ncbi:trp operon leader peptide [Escherichia albertii]|nr:trp operon leader peptide [Escherichia albertii]HBE7313336.1 trp operon leader peptide [Escherichia coli]
MKAIFVLKGWWSTS